MMISLFSCGKKSEVASGYGDLIFESIEKETGDATRPPEYQNQPESDNGGNETVPPADAPVTTITFAGCGDNIIYQGTIWEALAQANGGRAYNFKPIYSDVAGMIASADVSYINQETVMDGGEPSYYPCFNSPQDLGYDLAELGFDVVNIANNHMLDRGGSGITATVEFWKAMQGVTMIGGNRDRADYDEVEIIDVNGIRIALLSFCEMTNGITIGNDWAVWIPYLDENDIKNQCASVKDSCDLILCSVHWGDEGSFKPNEEQRRWAKIMADAGVDVIIGTHPHVIQPIEYIDRADGGKTLCAFSLGNFMAMQAYDFNMLGGIITFDINKRGDEHAYIDNVLFTPTVYYFAQNWYGSHVYFLSDFTDYLASTHGIGNYGNGISNASLRGYLNDTISNEFLPEEFRN